MGVFDWFTRTGEKRSPLYLFNTLGGKKEKFVPVHDSEVRMYNCGPTVYGRQHIGNLSMFVFTDIVRRTLIRSGYSVKQVINFTDFGHLTSDADSGEDKMTKGLKSEGLALTMENMRALGEKYANLFLEDLRALNCDIDGIIFPRASDYVQAQIAMIETLVEKGFAYQGKHGVYFETSKFPRYGKLGNINLEELRAGARVSFDKEKRGQLDFLLWKSDPHMGWDSPWGKGFPGWHIECSAMIRETLGEQIDIHTGGIEHIPVHHNNEIAQSESATGKHPFSKYWLHRAHIQLEGGKIAKSVGNVVYMFDVTERGCHPLSLRYLFLSAHYRTPMNFTWEALSAAQTAYSKLLAMRFAHKPSFPVRKWTEKFNKHVNDDFDTPKAIAVLWEMTKDTSLTEGEKVATMIEMDKVLGLNFAEPDAAARELARKELRTAIPKEKIDAKIKELLLERQRARENKDYARADAIRTRIEDQGFELDDSPSGPVLYTR